MMQAENRKLNESPKRKLSSIDIFKQIYKLNGIRGLWKGSLINVQRAALVNLGDLTTYDYMKRHLINNYYFNDNFITHTLSR
jgi:hypothetical protein